MPTGFAAQWNPAGAVTGLGPLPHTSPHTAVDYVKRAAPKVPFWPQLVQRDSTERVVDQALAPLADLLEPMLDRPWCYAMRPGVSMDEMLGALHERDVTLPQHAATGFYAFEHALAAGAFQQATALKGQLIGPITLAHHLFRAAPRGRWFADHPQLIYALGRYLTRLARWQIDRLRRFDLPVVLFVDEPVLGTTLAPAGDGGIAPAMNALSSMLASLRETHVMAALRCCQPRAVRWLDEAAPDLYAFDAYQGLARFCREPAGQAFAGAGHVAFGLVPTGQALDGVTAEGLFTRWLQSASVLGDVTAIARRSLITASGALGRVDPPAANATFNFAHRLSYLVSWIASGHHSEQRPSRANPSDATASS